MDATGSSDPIDHSPHPSGLAEHFKDPHWGAEQLRTIDIFRGFTSEELKDLYRQGVIESFRAGCHIVIEGEPTRGLYILLAGTVSVYKTDEAADGMYRLATLEPGANFGEMSLFDAAPRSATVSADTNCHLMTMNVDEFERFLKSCTLESQVRFYKSCSQVLAERFRKLNNDYIHAQKTLWKHALRKAEP